MVDKKINNSRNLETKNLGKNIYSEKEVVEFYNLSRNIPLEVLKDYCDKIIKSTTPKTLCDVGFGKGSTLIPFSMNSTVDIIGADASEEMTKFVEKELKKRKLNAKIINADANLLHSLIDNVDVLHLKAVTHIPKDPHKFLTELSKAIKPNGYFVIGKEYSQPEDNLEDIGKYGLDNSEDKVLKDFYRTYFDLRENDKKAFIQPKMPAGNYDEAKKYLIDNGFTFYKEITSTTWTKKITLSELVEAIAKGTFTVFSKDLSSEEQEEYAQKMREYCAEKGYDLNGVREYKARLKAIILKKGDSKC